MDEPASAAMEGPGRRPASPLDPFITAAFWTVAVVVLLNVRGIFSPENQTVHLLFQALRILCCLLLMGLVHVRLPQALGAPGALLLGSMLSYVVIGFFVSIATDAELHVHMYGFHLYQYVEYIAISGTLVLSATLGAYAILERVGMQAFLRAILLLLTASSTAVVFTPILRSMGVILSAGTLGEGLPTLDSVRLVGFFWGPNSAGYIGCMTAALALAFLSNVRRPVLAYLALTAGSAAVVGSLSKVAIVSLGVVGVSFLLLNGRSARNRILLWIGAMVLVGGSLVQQSDLGMLLRDEATRSFLFRNTVFFGRLATVAHLFEGWTGSSEDGIETSEDGIETSEDGSPLSGRLFLWELGLSHALESPIVGHGLGRMHLMDGAPFYESQNVQGSVHNAYLLLFGEAGIVPLSLYLLYLFSLLRLRWAAPKSLARDAIVSWTIIVVLQGIAFHELLQLGMYTFLGGVMCAMAAYEAREEGGRTWETPRTFA